MSATKSPLPGVPDQQAYERLLQGLGADMYRQIPLTFDPAALPRGIPLDPGTSAVRADKRKPMSLVLHVACVSVKLLKACTHSLRFFFFFFPVLSLLDLKSQQQGLGRHTL